ncbi:MAG TPA: MBL fold metallo-hydrolase [Clostridiaceae bacterium]|nr:MBL fold metallo-hydrolase [Clostridiaceae bacterium]
MRKRAYAPVALFIIFIIGIFGIYILLDHGILGAKAITDIDLVQRVNDPVKVHFIDVGQGDAILLQVHDKTVLIDAGPAANAQRVVGYLKSYGIERLDYIFLSHIHEDHMGGMAEVIRNFEVGSFYTTNKSTTTRNYENMMTELAKKGLEVKTAKAGLELTFEDDITLSLLSPNADVYVNPNNYSPVMRLSYLSSAFLFTGDAEVPVENEVLRRGLNISADVFKAAHHGSTTSNSLPFLEKVKPQYVVVTSEKGNDFSLPNESILQAFADLNATILKTEDMGNIVFSSNGKEVRLLNH